MAVLDIFNSDFAKLIQLVVKVILCILIFIFGFLTSIPVGITKSKFNGQCIMYGKTESIGKSQLRFFIEYGSKNNCNYVIGTQVLFGVIVGGLFLAMYGFTLLNQLIFKKENFLLNLSKKFIFNIVIVAATGFITFLTFIAACMLAAGLAKWCNELEEFASAADLKCSDFQKFDWQIVDGSSFHKQYKLAIATCWLATVCWIVLTLLSVLTLLNSRTEGETKDAPPVDNPDPIGNVSVSVANKY